MALNDIVSQKNLNRFVMAAFVIALLAVYAAHWQYYGVFGQELGTQLVRARTAQAKESHDAAIASLLAEAEESGPIVAYRHSELIDEDEKLVLREKLVDPLIAYARKSGSAYKAVIVTVPEKIGEKYEVLALKEDGDIREFTFGAREKDFDSWHP